MQLKTGGLTPPRKVFKKFYLNLLMAVVGRAMQSAYRTDRGIRTEIDKLGSDFTAGFRVLENGPSFIMKKEYDKKSRPRFRYIGSYKKYPDFNAGLTIKPKNLEAAFRLLTFRESTATAEAYSRFIVDGSLEAVCTFIRVFDRLEIFLLPKVIAKLAVKRYQSPKKKWITRLRIYFGIVIGR